MSDINEMSDREILVEILSTMREVRETIEGVAEQVQPTLTALTNSPVLKMLGVKL